MLYNLYKLDKGQAQNKLLSKYTDLIQNIVILIERRTENFLKKNVKAHQISLPSVWKKIKTNVMVNLTH